MDRNIRSHRHAESRFRHERDERIGDWQNRQRVLFADVQKFLDGTALTDTLLEYDNARDKEIDQIRSTINDETVRDVLIDKAMQDNPYRLWQAIENTLGAKKARAPTTAAAKPNRHARERRDTHRARVSQTDGMCRV